VILGAFAAHSLESVISKEKLDSFQTGVRYQMIHSIGLFILYPIAKSFSKNLDIIGYLFITGILLFCGSIYFLSTSSLTGIATSILGPVTPLGGLCFIAGWGVLFIKLLRKSD
ncbi:MAG: DUF423 domain-containing protein, partial [Flavobacteriales bacterium]